MVTSRPTGSKSPKAAEMRTHSAPVTAKGISSMVRPERKFVTNSPSRRTGRVCISPTLRALYR